MLTRYNFFLLNLTMQKGGKSCTWSIFSIYLFFLTKIDLFFDPCYNIILSKGRWISLLLNVNKVHVFLSKLTTQKVDKSCTFLSRVCYTSDFQAVSNSTSSYVLVSTVQYWLFTMASALDARVYVVLTRLSSTGKWLRIWLIIIFYIVSLQYDYP